VYLSGETSTIVEDTKTEQTAHPGILKKTPDENIRRKKGLFFRIWMIVWHKSLIGTRNNKQFDEKKENGAAQIFIPSNLIVSGKTPALKSILNLRILIGTKIITCRLDDNPLLPRTIQDCFVSINIEDYQSMNDLLAKEFNPLSITISSVENMPSTPVSYAELKQRLSLLIKMNLNGRDFFK
jgi:hypothetical protein